MPEPEDRDASLKTIVARLPLPVAEDQPAEKEELVGLIMAESFELQRLNRARQMIQDERWAQAANELGKLIQQSGERWYQPQRGAPQYRELRTEAERLLMQLPPVGQDAFESQFGPLARKLLNAAVETHDRAGIELVARNYFQTVAGTEATYRLGNMDFDAGHMLSGAMHFEHLSASSLRATELEPLLSLKRAICWSRLGENPDAQRKLAELKAKYPQATVTIEGEPRELFATPTFAADWLATVAPSNRSPHDWRTSRGQTHRNPITDVLPPVLLSAMSSPVVTNPQLQAPLNLVMEAAKKSRLGRIPSLQPIVIGDSIVFRSLTELRAVNGRGELLWSVPHEDALWEMLQPGNDGRLGGQTDYLKDFLLERIWEDSAFGTLASDGRFVFAVQSDRFEGSPELHRLVVSSDGRLMLNTTPQDGGNRLAAFDLASGKCVWERRAADSRTAVRYLGAPLVIGDNLFVIAQSKDETTLRELDGSSGETRRQWLLQADPVATSQLTQMWGMRFRPKTIEPVASSSPSFSDGLVLCRTGANRVVAIDLATNSLRWAYQAPRGDGAAVNVLNPWARVPRELLRQSELDHWCESSLVIAEGAVLLALPDSNDLRCLDLADGRLRWTVPRQDGLFVAGVQHDRVLVVGRSGMRAYRLDDGRNAWPRESVVWPLAAVPSGLSYLSQGRCYVPLSSSELVAIDIASGQVASRAATWTPVALGNLVASADNVYSLGTGGLLKFKTAESHLEPLKLLVREQPSNIDAATRQGEALLLSGRTSEAVEQLLRALKLDPAPEARARKQLVSLVTDGAALDPELRKSILAAIGFDSFSAPQRWQMQVDYAVSRERSGDFAGALDLLLAAAEIEVDVATLTNSERLRHESAARSVRNDRWFQGQFAQWAGRLEPEQRERLQQRLTALLPPASLPGSPPVPATANSPERFLALFGSQPIARDVRLKEVERFAASSELLRAELQLRTALDAAQPADERELLLRLKQLWAPTMNASIDRFTHWEREIGDRHFRETFSNGKLGSEIADAEPINSPIRKALNPPAQWASLRPLVTTAAVPTTPAAATNELKVIAQMLPHDRLDARSWLALDQAKRRWVGVDVRGRQSWELPSEKSFTLSYNMTGIPQARRVGPLLVVWSGQSLHAIEIDGAQTKQLWTMPTLDQNANDPQTQFGQRRIQRVQIALGNNRGARPETRWWAFIAQPNYVCFQRNRELQAVEPLTSRLLWKRDDLPLECDLMGDEHSVFAIDADSSRVQILSAIDGRTLAHRTLPERSSWVGLRGRQLTHWKPAWPFEEHDEEQQDLRGLDMLTEQELWRHRFARGSKHYLMGDTELAVVEPSGRFAVIDLMSGQVMLDTPTEPLPKLESVFVMESFDRYLVFADLPLPDVAEAVGFFRFNHMPVNVTGRCLAVNRTNGKVAWSRTISNQGFSAMHLREQPLLPLTRMTQKLVTLPNGQGQSSQTESHLQVLNVRTGDIEYEETSPNYRMIELQHDLVAQQVKYRGQTKQVDFDFSQK